MTRDEIDFLLIHGWDVQLGAGWNQKLGIRSPMNGDDAVRLQRLILQRERDIRREMLAWIAANSQLDGASILREAQQRWGAG